MFGSIKFGWERDFSSCFVYGSATSRNRAPFTSIACVSLVSTLRNSQRSSIVSMRLLRLSCSARRGLICRENPHLSASTVDGGRQRVPNCSNRTLFIDSTLPGSLHRFIRRLVWSLIAWNGSHGLIFDPVVLRSRRSIRRRMDGWPEVSYLMDSRRNFHWITFSLAIMIV